MTSNDEQRIAYLAGEPVEALSAAERAELDELRTLLHSSEAWAEPDPGLEERIVAAIAHEAASRPAAARPRRPALRLGVMRRRAWLGLGTVAAAAAAAAVIALAVTGAGPAPEQFAMVLYGTNLAPGAHASATLTKTTAGWRIELNGSGLPRRANGLYYEAWLKNAAGVLVPVGTFNAPAHVTLWSGVPATAYRTLTITEQQANGNPRSSGRRVLVGTIHPRS